MTVHSMNDSRQQQTRWLALAVLAVAQFMVVLDVTIVNVALPAIQTDLGFSADGLQWVVNAYTLAFGGLLLLGGRASDLLGRRRMFLVGLALFAAASLAGGLATSPEMLVAVRAVQGIGAALLSPAALALLTVTFPAGRERNIALGVWGALAGIGGTLGVVAGGVLVDSAGWEWIFFVNVPVALLGLIATPRFVTESRRAGRPGLRPRRRRARHRRPARARLRRDPHRRRGLGLRRGARAVRRRRGPARRVRRGRVARRRSARAAAAVPRPRPRASRPSRSRSTAPRSSACSS